MAQGGALRRPAPRRLLADTLSNTAPTSPGLWSPPGSPTPTGRTFHLVRRGVDHGHVVPAATSSPDTDTIAARWHAGEAIHFPRLVRGVTENQRTAIGATRAMFERLREGERFLDELDARIGDDEFLRYAGSTVDHGDEREIERVFVDVPGDAEHKRVRDLTARLSWIAHDESDDSLRIRFSFGHEATRDWLVPDRHSAWSDYFAATSFPENATLRREPALRGQLDATLGEPWRLSELIVYSNAPGGGAVFHHDADPGQRGVVYTQLDGITVWLACPRRRLAQLAALQAGLDGDTVFARMDDDADQDLWALLNTTPELTGTLVKSGHLFVLQGGDVLLLPSHDAERCCWHSVFGVGTRASLAHSMAIFDALPDELLDQRIVTA